MSSDISMAASPPSPSAAPTDLPIFLDSATASEPEKMKLLFDLYKIRAEEYGGRYESMRQLEWKILFQMYAGYAAIGIVYEHLRGSISGSQILLSWLAIVATVAFYAAARYLTYRIQERLIAFNTQRDKYLKKMHELLKDTEIPRPDLGNRYHWSYHTQLMLSTFASWCLIGYEAMRALSAAELSGVIVAGTAAGVLAASLWFGWKLPEARK